jgi:L-amino acid N-acyltransferase YncA
MNSRIRRVDSADAAAVQAIYAPCVTDNATSFETVVPDVLEIRRRIEAQANHYPWLVFEADRNLVGYAYASAHRSRQAYRWSVDVSVYVADGLHRRGIGRALYASLLGSLRRQGFVNAYAGITLPNPSSVGLHASLGFEPVGTYRRVGFKFDRWHDVMWLHLRLQEGASPPNEPFTTEQLWNDPTVTEILCQHAQGVGLD